MATKTVIETICSGCGKVHRDDDLKKVSSLALKKFGTPPEGWYLVADANNQMHHVCDRMGHICVTCYVGRIRWSSTSPRRRTRPTTVQKPSGHEQEERTGESSPDPGSAAPEVCSGRWTKTLTSVI